MPDTFKKNLQYYKFCGYGFLKNLRFFDPFLILFFREKGLTFTQIGTLYAIREILSNIMGIPTGMLADTFGRRKSMVFSFAVYIVSFVIYYLSENYLWLLIATIFFAFGEAFRTGTHKAMIIEYLNLNGWADQKVHYYGHTRAWSQTGSALSALIGAAIVFTQNEYRFVFIFSAIPYILDMLLILSYPATLEGEPVSFSSGKVLESFKNVIDDFIITFRKKEILKGVANLSVHTGYYKALKDYLQPILQGLALALPVFVALENKKREALIIGFVYFLLYLSTSFAARGSGKLTDRFRGVSRPLNITMIAGFCMGILSGVFLNLNLLVLSVVLYIGIYLMENVRKPMGIAYISDMLDPRIMATALSAESQAESLTAAIIAPIIGVCADKLGIGYALIITSALVLISALFYAVGKFRK